MCDRFRMIQIFWMTLRCHLWLAAGMILAIAGTIITGILPPLILGAAIDRLSSGIAIAIPYAVGYFLIFLLAGLFEASKESLITIFGQKITHELRTQMNDKLSRLPADYFIKNDPGMITSRMVNDVDTVDSLFTSGVISMVVDACKIISFLGVIFWKSRGLGILLLLVTPLMFAFTRMVQKRMLGAQKRNRIAVGETTHQIPETLENIRTIKVFHKECYMETRYDTAVQKSFRAMEESNFYDAIYSPVIILTSAVIVAVMMVLSAGGGSFQAYFGMTVGTAVAIIAYVGKIFSPLESIGMEIQNIQSAVAGVHRITEFMTETERILPEKECEFQKDATQDTTQHAAGKHVLQEHVDIISYKKVPETAVCFRHMTFGYDRNQPIFHDFSLEILKGEHVTFTGRTGVGKSTLFKLLLGLYQPQKGQVLIFQKPADTIPDADMRTMFGFVEQNFQMIAGTVGEQISLKDPRITEAEITAALQVVGLMPVVQELEQGLATLCRDQLFSQGQMQLLSIARAIVKNPKILLLDEITANLDSWTERQVLDTLQQVSQGRTVISISHRIYEASGGRKVNLE